MLTPVPAGLNGANNDHLTINAALALSNTIILEGQYNISGPIVVPYSGSTPNASVKPCIICHNAQINTSTNNIIMLLWADSWGAITGKLLLNCSGSGCSLLAVQPQLGNANTSVVQQNFNTFENINFNGGDNQLVLMAGIPIGGQASGCYYNQFKGFNFTNGKRAIWLQDNSSTNAGNSGSNSNRFFGMTVNGSTNTGLQIDAGGDNEFFGFHGENIATGTAPNTTPLAIKIAGTMASGGTNDYNSFVGATFENCTQQIVNGSALTSFLNHNINPSLASGTAYIDRDAATGGYTAGTGISISGSVISGAYTAGSGIAISGAAISATGGGGGSPTPNLLQKNVGSPTGTASGSGVMMGLNATFTPNLTGDIEIIASAYFGQTGIGGAFGQLAYGTGTPPSNGAAATGTTVGGSNTWYPSSAGATSLAEFNAIVSGLTLGTTYWVDLIVGRAASNGTASVNNVSISVDEKV